MCLGIPGRIIEITDPSSQLAMVDVLGVRREINIACIVDTEASIEHCVGAWVLVHVGFAMSRIDAEEARQTLELLRELGQAEAELDALRDTDRIADPPAPGVQR